ncbi:hypothetical protein E4U58_001807 [Claviceps cyperi]|nr:hypothetical protein E4U58_001807 [Claviceps cyperi]
MATESIICPPGYGYNDCEEDLSCSPWVFCSQISTTTSTARSPTSTMEWPGAYSSSSRSTSPLPSPSPARKADSGVTHTIPNSSLVTVTRHGVVFSESPSSEKAAASRGLCSTCAPTSTFTSSPSTDVSERGSPSAEAIAGAATAAAIIIIIIIILSIGKSELILVFVLRRRKKHRASCDASEAETLGSDSGATGSEKSNSLKDAFSFSRMSKDPFAPFGGRADNPDYPYRPSTGTFELDGVAITVVELPATSIPEMPDTVKTVAAAPDEASDPEIVKTAARAPDKASESRTAPPTPEPAATLASPSSPQGKIVPLNDANANNINTKADAGANAQSFDRSIDWFELKEVSREAETVGDGAKTHQADGRRLTRFSGTKSRVI